MTILAAQGGTRGRPQGPNRRLPPFFRHALLLALAIALPAFAAGDRNATAAAQLSGTWTLVPAASDDPQAKLSEAVATRKKPRRPRREPQLDEIFVPDEPVDPRHETQVWENELAAPAQIAIQAGGDEVRITTGPREQRVYSPGQPYARVDTRGTARISSAWKSAAFEVRERYQRYDRGGSRTETYALDRSGRLTFTRVIEMPMFGTVTIRSVYVRS